MTAAIFSDDNTRRIRHVILDRDGVINEESPSGYILSPKAFIWIPGVRDALSMIAEAGIAISVATNQSCVGRGLIEIKDLDRIHDKMKMEAAEMGVSFAGIFFCPHTPESGCRCRKPAPGLLEAAIRQSGIPRSETIFVGDADRDLQAAAAAGVAAFLVRTGKGADTEKDLKNGIIREIAPENLAVFDDLLSASRALTAGKERLEK